MHCFGNLEKDGYCEESETYTGDLKTHMILERGAIAFSGEGPRIF